MVQVAPLLPEIVCSHGMHQGTPRRGECLPQRWTERAEHLLVESRIEVAHDEHPRLGRDAKHGIYHRAQRTHSQHPVLCSHAAVSCLAGQMAHHDMERVTRRQDAPDIKDVTGGRKPMLDGGHTHAVP